MSVLICNFYLNFKIDQITHGLKSVQLEDEDASKYYINYISDDDSDDLEDENHNEHENNHIKNESNNIDVSSLPNSLIITPVPQELFTNQQWKVR